MSMLAIFTGCAERRRVDDLAAADVEADVPEPAVEHQVARA